MAASAYDPGLGRTGLRTPAALPEDRSALSSPLAKVAYYITMLYVVLLVGRVPEICASLFNTTWYQISVLNVVLVAFLVITGVALRVGATRGGTIWIAFHLWILFTLPFSGYRRGSIDAFVTLLPYIPSLFFVAAFFSRNTESFRRGLWAFAWAGVVGLAFIAFRGGQGDEDRYSAEGTFSNSNLLAIYLLTMAPVWAYIVMNSANRWIFRLFFAGQILWALSIVIRTGSRSGFLTLGILVLMLFFAVSWANKVTLIVAVVVLGSLGATTMSSSLRARLGTIFQSEVRDEVTYEATGSAQERMQLFLDSVQMTIHHPLVGAGFGVYSSISAGEKAARGEKANWLVSHNMYTQISSELGFPGFFIYVAGLAWSIRALFRVRKTAKLYPDLAELGTLAATVLCCWTVFCFNGAFTSNALDFLFYVLAGFSIALWIVCEDRLRQVLQRQQNAGFSNSGIPAGGRSSRFFPPAHPAPGVAVTAAGRADLETTPAAAAVTATAAKYSDAPWRRNPRKHPPKPGTPSR